MEDQIFHTLCDLLQALDGVEQDPYWHPEGDALFHSLQVHAIAACETQDADLLAAALLHDVGKARPGHHEVVGAQLLQGLVPERVVWLVRHHLDLMRRPTATHRKLAGNPRLRDLQLLRRWDLDGRDPDAWVSTVEEAVTSIREVFPRAS